jgi:UDP-2,3-diacylglucosamine pyrophosphatase LpxH
VAVSPKQGQLKYRTVFVSDVHLGFKGSSAEYLLDFLHSIETETLYLVGDIVDVWSLRKTFFWPQTHNDVVRKVLDMAQRGTRVVYIPGNHDEIFRDYDGLVFGDIEVRREAVHETADGRRMLVLHGDEFDGVIKLSPWLGHLGCAAYAFALFLNRLVNGLRRHLGFPYWSLAAYLKHKVKKAVSYISRFEHALACEARRRGVDGMICGHIHRAEIAVIDGILYCNDGDWVESCTTLTEDADGRLEIIRWVQQRPMARRVGGFSPQAVHIATEGPLGLAARRWCRRSALPFTTSYHTQFPEYVRARAPIPLALSYAHLRRFHGAAVRTMVATPSMQAQLEARGFRNVVRWSRGVDVALFQPHMPPAFALPRPVSLYMGRVAIEKNIEDFLRLDLPGTKVVIGDGPARSALEMRYPDVVFTGYRFGEELARHVASADVFVFPSRTDTFGLVLLEAMACGVPVAAYPVTGSVDVVATGVSGILDTDLRAATLAALELDRSACRAHALEFTWERATDQFLKNLAPRADVMSAAASLAASG